MKRSLPCAVRLFSYSFLLVLICAGVASVSAATNKKPVLISQSTSTRALALECATMQA